MMIPVLIAFLGGAALGLRYKVLILLPATALALPFVIWFAWGDSVWEVIGSTIAVATSLQLGYVMSIGIQSFIKAPSQSDIVADVAPTHRALP